MANGGESTRPTNAHVHARLPRYAHEYPPRARILHAGSTMARACGTRTVHGDTNTRTCLRGITTRTHAMDYTRTHAVNAHA
jgi:hypothetical protein